MTRRKERTLKELNEVTDKILEPEITPVLKGSFRIQGPVEEADYDIQMNMGSSQDGRRFGRRSQPGKVWSRAESGTCNVCAAPCSSCMHFNRDVSHMGSKTDEFSDETCRGKAASRCSFSDAVNKGRLCDDWQSIVSENSNLLSTSSSHDSFSENAESKATLKAFNASEDIDVLSAEGCVRSKLLSAAGKKTFSNQYEEQKDSECNDDNISCVIGSSEGSMLAGDHYRDVDRSNRSNSSVSFSNLLPDGSEMMVPGQIASGSWPKFHCGIGESNDNSGKPCASAKESALKSYNVSLSTANHAKDLEEISCSQCRGEPSECSSEHLESSSARLEISDSFGGKKSAPHTCAGSLPKSETSELIVVRNNSSGASTKIYPVLEAEADGCSGDPPNAGPVEQVNKSSSSHAVSMPEPALISQPVDESELDDVKVCDICGDAGREELLAICSRCSDGAEHTYCMQIMVDKLPEGDWLCEECKLKEEIEHQKQDESETVLGPSKDKSETVSGTPKAPTENSQNSGGTGPGPSKLSVKVDMKESDVEGSRTNEVSSSPRVSVKRHADNLEVASAPKRQALELKPSLPKASSPTKKVVLSRDGSFKNLDKGKVRHGHHMSSFGGHVANCTPGTSQSPTASGHNSRIKPRLEMPRGTLSKSHSFSTSISKSKGRLVEDDLFLKQKSPREPATSGPKQEGCVKMFKKSLSFKTPTLGCSNVTESKVKMLPSNMCHFEDPKGLKRAKAKSSIERKTSFKADRVVVSSLSSPMIGSGPSLPKVDQKITTCGEVVSSVPSTTKCHDQKAIQVDGKLSTSLKAASQFSHKAVSGGIKSQSSCLANAVGAPLSNATCHLSAEQNPNQVFPKKENVSSSWSADISCNNHEASIEDGLPQSQESPNQIGKTVLISSGRPKQIVSAGNKNIHCQRCNELGHDAQACQIGSPRVSVLEASAARGSVEAISKNNKFKDSVEAAACKQPGMYKKNRFTDEISLSSTDLNHEVASKNQLPDPLSCLKTLVSSEGTHELQENLRSTTSEISKAVNVNDVKQHALHLPEAVSTSRGDSDAVVSSDGKPFIGEKISLTPAVVDPFRNTAIPEHDCIWKGGFHLQRNGKLSDSYDGIQAHLSTCASPKVLEVVNKLPQEVLLEEVPRQSTWPTQFQNNFATEDNIALYFFAKDIESYERKYKSLLENIMKSDLALKANFDGIELLIFSSNQLPEKSQRWNMLFFLWGVFRGRRKCTEHISDSQMKDYRTSLNVLPLSESLLTPVMPVSQRTSLAAPEEKDLSACNTSCNTLQEFQTMSLELPVSASGCAYTISENKVLSNDQNLVGLHKNLNQQAVEPDTYSLSRVPTSDAQLCMGVKHPSVSGEEGSGDPESKEELEPKTFVQESRQSSNTNRGKTELVHLDNSPDRQDTSSFSSKLHSGGTFPPSGEVGAVKIISEETIQERMDSDSRDPIDVQWKLKEEENLMETETNLDEDTLMGDLADKKNSSWTTNGRKRPYSGYQEMVSHVPGEILTSSNQAVSWNKRMDPVSLVEEIEIKKLKRCYSDMYGCDNSRDISPSSERSQKHDIHSSSPLQEQTHNGAFSKMVIPEILQGSERDFFPVNSVPIKDNNSGSLDLNTGSSSTPVQIIISDDEDEQESEVPNLELALGAEMKPPKRGVLPLFVGIPDKASSLRRPQAVVTNIKDEDDDISASLSLSLASPFSAKEKAATPVSKSEKLLPNRNHVNTSLFLFRGLPDT